MDEDRLPWKRGGCVEHRRLQKRKLNKHSLPPGLIPSFTSSQGDDLMFKRMDGG